MKTLNHFLNFNKTTTLCERTGKRLSASSLEAQSLGVHTSITQQIKMFVHAVQDRLVSRSALMSRISLAEVNSRIFVGLVLIGIVAPLAGCFYLLLDKSVIVDGWYYVNNFYLFLVLGPFLNEAFIYIGVYHLFPQGSKRAYLLTIPMGITVGKILWLLTISSNDQFHSVAPLDFVFVGFVISAGLFFVTDWLAWRKFHRADAFDARLTGLFQIADDIPAEKVASMFKTTMREKLEFKKQY